MEVVRLGKLFIERDRPLERSDGIGGAARPVPGQSELVLNAGGGIVQVNRLARTAPPRPRSGPGRTRRSPSISRGRVAEGSSSAALRRSRCAARDIPPALVGFSPPEIRQHGGGLEGDGARVGLYGDICVVPGERGVPVGHELPEPPFLVDGDIAGDRDPRGAEDKEQGQ